MAKAQARYEQLVPRRQPFLDRAWDYAELTIPSILPRHGHNHTTRLHEPYQAFTARCVLNLHSHLLMALLPPGTPFFRYQIPPEVLLAEEKTEPDDNLKKLLGQVENLTMSEVERRAWRQPTSVSLLSLIVTGNVLEQVLPDNRLRIFRLDQYVVLRDGAGNVLELVVQEKINPLALPDEVRKALPAKAQKQDEDVTLYTWQRLRKDGRFEISQEVEGVTIGKPGIYKISPFIPLRWAIIPGEDYGRGKCEEHSGDLRSFEAYSKAMVDGAAMAARHLWMLRPNATGTNLKARIARANNGDVILGNIEDVGMLQFENATGLQLVQSELQRLAESLAAAFLLRSGVIRDSERTTAEEVRLVAEELEGTLGGVYSLLSEDMMRRRLERLTLQMQSQGKLPQWPEGAVEPTITVGLEALGREKDVVRVRSAAEISQLLDPNQEYTKTGELLTRAYVGLGLPNAVRSDEEVMARRREMAEIEAIASAGGALAGSTSEGE